MHIFSTIILTITLLTFFSANATTQLRFIAIGDTPYSEIEVNALKETLPVAIKKANPAFVVHYGDIKNGQSDCSEVLLKERRDDIYNLLPGLVFYTPGDNEWTDCDRAQLKNPLSELAALDRIRQLFFHEPVTLTADWDYKHQPGYPENARWTKQDILFVTVHLVGTNNARKEILKDDIELALALVDARDQANRIWLKEAFSQAMLKKSKAVVIITQADVTEGGSGTCADHNNRINCDGFADFYQHLQHQAKNFHAPDQPAKPVLLIHGDTRPYCWDKKFGGNAALNLWRLNAWGDYQTPPDATEITVQLDNITEPFAARTLTGHKLPQSTCD